MKILPYATHVAMPLRAVGSGVAGCHVPSPLSSLGTHVHTESRVSPDALLCWRIPVSLSGRHRSALSLAGLARGGKASVT